MEYIESGSSIEGMEGVEGAQRRIERDHGGGVWDEGGMGKR